MKKIILSLLMFFSLAAFFSAEPAAAGKLWDAVNNEDGLQKIAPEFGSAGGQPKDVRDIVVSIVKVFLGFLGLFFVILIMAAGYKWMVSQGSPDKVKEARNQIVQAVIGLMIVMAAYAITVYVGNVLSNVTTEL